MSQQAKNLLRRVGRRLFRIQEHFILEATCTATDPVAWLEGETPVSFSANNPLPTSLHQQLVSLRRHDQPYVDDVRAGKAQGLLVLNNGNLVHCSYLMFENKTACLLGYGRGVGLIGNCFTASSYRGNGCQGRVAQALILMAKAAGLTEVIAETSPDNQASQRGLQKGGMRLIGEIRLLVIVNTLIVRTIRPAKTRVLDLCV